jgi:carbon-monoxide dehydrogenase small subunit
MTVNNKEERLQCEPRQSLLEILRNILRLTGTKEGCNDGNCGACTVVLDGVAVNSCCVLAMEAEGSTIKTVEGLATGNDLHPLQKAFLDETALQCGYCTPGFLMSAEDLLRTIPDPTERDIRFWLANNLCRCTGYERIVRAVVNACQRTRRQQS